VLALDQGTTSSRALVFDRQGQARGLAQREIRQIYPRPGWVEHDPTEIWESQRAVAGEALAAAGIGPADVAAVGITNQRETTIVWERATGRPVHNAIVWQCRRTTEICERLRGAGHERAIRDKTGLVVDAYFSGPKVQWILDRDRSLRPRAERGELCFGTVDAWLIFNLTGGRVHATDVSNASRTMLLDTASLDWDEALLGMMGIPRAMLPVVKGSSEAYGMTDPDRLLGACLPIAGNAGDQQASLFGQACFRPGMAKNTYGTGCFLLMNTGGERRTSEQGLVGTVAWRRAAEVAYALEGSVFIAGAAIQWLRDGLRIIDSAPGSEAVAREVPDNGGVYFVPAFVGLGAPHWDMYARGTLVGITRGTARGHIARAALEAMAYQTRDVIEAMEADSGVRLAELRVDGGAVGNALLMQFQADLLGVPVVVPEVAETTALGAAYLAGLAVGFWDGLEALERNFRPLRRYEPAMPPRERDALYRGWRRAVERAKGWAT
jgi:glycerol kinase